MLFRQTKSKWKESIIVVWLCLLSTYRCRETAPSWSHFACSCILGKKDVNTMATRVCYLWPKKRGIEKVEMTNGHAYSCVFSSEVAMVFTSLFPKLQLHAKWHHESAVLLQQLVIKKQNHTTIIYQCVPRASLFQLSLTARRDEGILFLSCYFSISIIEILTNIFLDKR